MSRINTNFRWITTGAFFVAYFLYFIVLNRYHLIYLEQIQLFRFSEYYFTDFFSRPGGLSEFTGAFLTQFFLFPFAGASIVTLAGIAVYVIIKYIFHKHHISGVLWAFVPVLLLAALHSYHLYSLAYTIGLIVSLGYFAVYISIGNNKLRYFFGLTGWPLLYFIAGGYSLLTIMLCFIHELFFSRNWSRFIIASVFPILALVVPYLASHFIFYINEGMAWTFFLPLFIGAPFKYILILLLIYYPLVLTVSKAWITYSKREVLSPGWNWKTIIAGTLFIVCLSGVIIKYIYDRKTEVLLGIDHYVQRSDWDGVLKLSSSSRVTNRMVMHFTNFALYKTGHMGDQLFHYQQAGSAGLWLDWEQDWIIAFFGGEIYYHLAYNSEAYRWAFEAMVAKGPNPRSLKRLVVTSLVDNNIALAEKYLKVLDQTLFYRKWAQHYLNYVNDPERLNEDKEISEKRHFEIHSDFINSDNFGVRLPQLLADHPDNHMVFEYFMASLLLDKNLDGFAANIYRLKELGYKSIPVHYEEALLAYMSYAKKNIVPEGYTISLATRNRLSDYAATIYSFGDNTGMAARAMYSKFGKTYWYYLKFINNQPQ
ncbi:MAG: DUF6057 family protein [Bacteroidales bacterium]|nr:DUF6057 family protein [Bacteroidales bacterium]